MSSEVIVYNHYMAKKVGWLLIIVVLVFVSGGLIWQISHAQKGRSEFPETGHVIRGEFYHFYWAAKDPVLVYGYPITDVTTDVTTGRLVQYFQRALFVLHPEASSEYHVQLAPLGEYLYEPGEPITIAGKLSNCRTFEETGKQVCYAFLEFYEKNGDVQQFGYPISNFEFQYGRIVQYFQRARFEWYPELPSGQRVKLADLGIEYFYTVGEDLIKRREGPIYQTVTDLHVRAYPDDPLISMEGKQTIYVLVRDQRRQPVPTAEVEVVVRFPSGVEKRFTAQSTNADGVSTVAFDVNTQTIGRALVWVYVSYGNLQQTTTTSFRVWY